MRASVYLLIAVGVASIPGYAESLTAPLSIPDFRKTTWGMTKDEVLAAESKPPSEVREAEGELVVRYDSMELAGVQGRVIYIFAKNKLVRAKYVLEAEHQDLNDFIVDYRTIEPLLMSAYGKPTWQRAVWEDDSLQDERKSYLDQDRAVPDSILPSDRFVGLAIALGQLKLYTERGQSRTKVLHAMTGEDGQITHQVEYRSVALSAFEDEVRRQSLKP